MSRRTYESHMDWEYQGSGPVDPTSPFTHAARTNPQNIFGSPAKAGSQPNLFAKLSSPAKQPPPPQSSIFTPQLSSKNTAPPFRNPAFTTPRRAYDELVLSEASGAEDSPQPRETFDSPNDTADGDHSDVNMGGTITPAKVDKAYRYGKPPFSTKKHTPGKGEIRSYRDRELSFNDVRKRKRHNQDRDVSSVVRYSRNGWDDSEAESDDSFATRPQNRSRNKKKPKEAGLFGSLLHMLDEHPNAPANLYRWIQLIINIILISGLLGLGYTVFDMVRSDISNANESARLELVSRMTECQTQYTMNECSKKDRPALRMMCDEWYDCMIQNPESIMRIKVTAKQIAEIINEFSETMNLKAWGFFFATVILCAFANNVTLNRHGGSAQPAPSQPASSVRESTMPPESTPGAMWVQVQTPRMPRHALLEDETDTDATPPQMRPLLPPYTPSGRRSPSKEERSRSPTKYGRSPKKGY